jgi:hypothetical protein
LVVKVLSSKVLASVLGVLVSLSVLTSHGAHSGTTLSEHALHGEPLHGHRLHHHHEHNHWVHGLVSSAFGLSYFGKFIVLVLIFSNVVVNIDLSSVVKGFNSFVSLAFLEGSLSFFRVFEFDESEFSFDLNLVFEHSVILFGFSDSDFLQINGSELFEGIDELFDSGLFFEIFGEQVGIISKLGVFFLSRLLVLEPADVKFGSAFKEVSVFVGVQNFFSRFFVGELDKRVGVSSFFLESDHKGFNFSSVLGEIVFEFFFNFFFRKFGDVFDVKIVLVIGSFSFSEEFANIDFFIKYGECSSSVGQGSHFIEAFVSGFFRFKLKISVSSRFVIIIHGNFGSEDWSELRENSVQISSSNFRVKIFDEDISRVGGEVSEIFFPSNSNGVLKNALMIALVFGFFGILEIVETEIGESSTFLVLQISHNSNGKDGSFLDEEVIKHFFVDSFIQISNI